MSDNTVRSAATPSIRAFLGAALSSASSHKNDLDDFILYVFVSKTYKVKCITSSFTLLMKGQSRLEPLKFSCGKDLF